MIIKVTNGWRMTSPFIYQDSRAENIEWLAMRQPGLVMLWVEGRTLIIRGPLLPLPAISCLPMALGVPRLRLVSRCAALFHIAARSCYIYRMPSLQVRRI